MFIYICCFNFLVY